MNIYAIKKHTCEEMRKVFFSMKSRCDHHEPLQVALSLYIICFLTYAHNIYVYILFLDRKIDRWPLHVGYAHASSWLVALTAEREY